MKYLLIAPLLITILKRETFWGLCTVTIQQYEKNVHFEMFQDHLRFNQFSIVKNKYFEPKRIIEVDISLTVFYYDKLSYVR